MKLITTLTSMAALSLLTATSQATIYWDFAQVNNDVVARVHGNFVTRVLGSGVPRLYSGHTYTQASVSRGAASPDGLQLSFDSFGSGESYHFERVSYYGAPTASKQLMLNAVGPNRSFGFGGGMVLASLGGLEFNSNIFRWSSVFGDTFDPSDVVDTTILYRNVTLASSGFDQSLTGTVLWQLRNTTNVGNAVVLRVVPEPSSTALAGLGVLILVIRRKR